MRRLSIVLIPCIGILLLAGLLLKASFVSAAPATVSTAGCRWQLVHSPNVKGGAGNILRATAAISANDVWAVGDNTNPGVLHTLTEHWDGKSWKIVPSVHPSGVGSIFYGVAAVSTNDVWAVGYTSAYRQTSNTLIEHWDGTQWSVVPSPNIANTNNNLYAVTAVSSNDVWAVGNYQNANFTLIEHWNGTQWSIVPSPNLGSGSNALYGVTAISANDIWAVGYSFFSNTIEQTLTEHWNGTQWSVVRSPNIQMVLGNFLDSVSAVSSNDVWATGSTVNGQAPILHWDGTRWTLVPGPIFKQIGSSLNAVVAVSSNNVWAMGGLGAFSQQTLIERWDGTQWNHVSSPNVGNTQNELFGGTLVPGTTQVWTVGVGAGQTLTEFHC